MLTVFAIPKPFVGHIGLIQRNALGAWARLGRGCELLLFGDETGTAEAAREIGARHVPEVARNARGTPLVSDLFAQARQIAAHPVLVYANADMILTGDLPRAVARVPAHRRFLLCGRRWNLSVRAPLQFDDGWEARLRAAVAREGTLAIPGAIDYFAFPRDLFDALPPFAVGRIEWDQWLLYRARFLGAWLIDATATVLAVHQSHDYSHLTSAPRRDVEGEVEGNRALALFHRLDLRDATHLLTEQGLRRALDGTHLARRAFSLPKFYLPTSPPVRALYGLWRRRVRGLATPGGLRGRSNEGQ
jgi:hypothetical protein